VCDIQNLWEMLVLVSEYTFPILYGTAFVEEETSSSWYKVPEDKA
jgi:hypothetical protein